jgi:hypothetical protein
MEGLSTQTYLDYLKNNVFNNEVKATKFASAIKNSESLVAGGSVLRAYSYYSEGLYKDIDIYVHMSKALQLYNGLKEVGYNSFRQFNMAPAYDQSFFMKNNILARFTIIDYTSPNRPIDIMLIPDNIPLTSVVQNFDLTFCEIWFDGEKIYATDIDGILNKRGTIRQEYKQALLENFNRFIIKRIIKYTKRGFLIKYDCEGEKTVNIPIKSVSPENIERWVVTYLYKNLMSYGKFFLKNTRENHFLKFVTNSLQKYTMENLKNSLQNNIEELLRPRNDTELTFLYRKCLVMGDAIHIEEPYITYINTYTGITKNQIKQDDRIFRSKFEDWELKIITDERNFYMERNIRARLTTIGFLERNVPDDIQDSDSEGEEDEEDQSDSEQEDDLFSPRSQNIKEIIDFFFNSQPPETLEQIKVKIFEWYGSPARLNKKILYLLLSLSNAYTEKNLFQFETYVVDENLIAPKDCYDVIMFDTYKITEYLREEMESIMFVNVSVDDVENFSVLCYTKAYIRQYISDYGNKIFYECNGSGAFIDYENDQIIEGRNVGNSRKHNLIPYIKLPLVGGTNVLFPLYQIWKVLESDKKVFYVFRQPDLEFTISHDVSYNDGSYVSANHCQDGTAEAVYNIKICGGDKCIIGRQPDV